MPWRLRTSSHAQVDERFRVDHRDARLPALPIADAYGPLALVDVAGAKWERFGNAQPRAPEQGDQRAVADAQSPLPGTAAISARTSSAVSGSAG